jgi:hypothetical protein
LPSRDIIVWQYEYKSDNEKNAGTVYGYGCALSYSASIDKRRDVEVRGNGQMDATRIEFLDNACD